MHKANSVLFFLFFILFNLSAQEKLIKKNGDTLAIKLIELNEKYVIYNKTILDDERIFTTPIGKFLSLIHTNGRIINLADHLKIQKEYIDSLKNPEFPVLYAKKGYWGVNIYSDEKDYCGTDLLLLYSKIGDTEAKRLLEKGRNQNIFGNILGLPAGYILGYQIGRAFSGQKINPLLMFAGTIGSAISLGLNVRGISNMKKSVKSYNESVILKYGLNENGLGLIMEF